MFRSRSKLISSLSISRSFNKPSLISTTSKKDDGRLKLTRSTKGLSSLAIAFILSACGDPSVTNFSFSPVEGVYKETQTITINVPIDATNVYLTTDNVEPIHHPNCEFQPGEISFEATRPTMIRVTYDYNGMTYNEKGLFVIEDGVTNNNYTNRDVITAWENLYFGHLAAAFGPNPSSDQTRTVNDGYGGSATRITDVSYLSGSAIQTFSFDNYSYEDLALNNNLTIEQGEIYGYFKPDRGGYYNTDPQGLTLVYSGTYNGTADGDFIMDGEGNTISGYYTINCIDLWCFDSDVIYAMNSKAEYVEVSPIPDQNTISCE